MPVPAASPSELGRLPLAEAYFHTHGDTRPMGMATARAAHAPPAGRLVTGLPADLVLIDTDVPWRLEAANLKSISKNTPFEDRLFQGRALRTMVGGRTVYVQGEER